MPVVLITGANRGLGLEFARQYLADGWQVFASCRDPASAAELQRLAKGSSSKLTVVSTDVTDAASIHKAATQLDEVAIDLVINSAGIIGVSGQRAGKDCEELQHEREDALKRLLRNWFRNQYDRTDNRPEK